MNWRNIFLVREISFYFSTLTVHIVEKRQILIYSHWKKIRQINYLVISSVKPILSRNFCQKRTVPLCAQWKKREILWHQKIFRQINSLVTYSVKPLLSRNFCQKCVSYSVWHLVLPILLKKNLFSKGFTSPQFFQPLCYL